MADRLHVVFGEPGSGVDQRRCFPFGDSATAVRIMRSTSPAVFGAVCRCLFTRFVGDDDRGVFATVVVCAEVSRPLLSVAGKAETE